MELSSLIFVALAVAWAAYLIPKALQHHEEVVRSRSVDRFSHRMRVLARREPVDRRNARLVVTPGREPAPPVVATKASRPSAATSEPGTRRPSGRGARRRRRVLALLLLAVVAVAGVAAFALISWWYVAIPAGLLLAWLVACRLMVRSEHAARRRGAAPTDPDAVAAPVGSATVDDGPVERAHDEDASRLEDTAAHHAVPAGGDPALWDPLPVTLPTYVAKSTARRTVRTIDLDATGVWSSGRSEADSAMARDAEESERASRRDREGGSGRRAVGT